MSHGKQREWQGQVELNTFVKGKLITEVGGEMPAVFELGGKEGWARAAEQSTRQHHGCRQHMEHAAGCVNRNQAGDSERSTDSTLYTQTPPS